MRDVKNMLTESENTEIPMLDKVINYMRKYSLENINVYIYVKDLIDYILP